RLHLFGGVTEFDEEIAILAGDDGAIARGRLHGGGQSPQLDRRSCGCALSARCLRATGLRSVATESGTGQRDTSSENEQMALHSALEDAEERQRRQLETLPPLRLDEPA